MNLRDFDWAHHWQGLLGPALLLTACTVVWGATMVYAARATLSLQAAQQALGGLEAERDEFTSRREAQRRFARLYRQLSVNGVIGPEQRLAWIQTTRDAGRELQLPYLRYSTSPQQPFEAPWLVPGVTASVFVSRMDLQLGLVHELDLPRLVARLRAAPGLLQIQSCSLEMANTDMPPEADRANLTGSCLLDIYSIPREPTLTAANQES